MAIGSETNWTDLQTGRFYVALGTAWDVEAREVVVIYADACAAYVCSIDRFMEQFAPSRLEGEQLAEARAHAADRSATKKPRRGGAVVVGEDG